MATAINMMYVNGKQVAEYDGPFTDDELATMLGDKPDMRIEGIFPCSLAGVIELDADGALDLIYYECTGSYLNDCSYRLVGCKDDGDTMLLYIEGLVENY